MTVDLNEHYGVTISEADRTSAGYVAVGELFSRRKMDNIGISVRGEGRTWVAASERALNAARAQCPSRPPKGDA